MDLELMRELSVKTDSKIVLLILDLSLIHI